MVDDDIGTAVEAALEGEFEGPFRLRGYMLIWVADAVEGDDASEYAGFLATAGLSRWEKIGLLRANLEEQLHQWEKSP